MTASKILIVDDETLELLRCLRAQGHWNGRAQSTPFTLGELAIDPAARSATMEGVPVRLTNAEFLALEVLARSVGQVQSRATLTYQALGRRLEPFDRSIDTHISNIRRKLRLTPGRGIEIKSARGLGYVLTIPSSRADDRLLSSACPRFSN